MYIDVLAIGLPMGTVRYSYLTQHIFVAEDDSQFFIVKRLTEDGYKFEEANTGFSDQDGGIYVYDGSLLVVTATGHLEDVLDTARLLKPVLPLTTPVFLSVTGVEDGYEIDQDRTRDHHVKVHELYKAGLTPANYSQLVTMA